MSEYFPFDTAQAKTLERLLADAGGAVADGAVTNVKVASDAAIALNKLANVAAGTDGLSAGTIQATFQAQATAIANLNAWATALATKLNAQFTVANAEDTLPFSPALAVDYDTNPQA